MKKYLFITIVASLFTACGGEDPIEEVVEDVVEDGLTPARAEKAQLVFQTVPSPIETASLFQDAGAGYNGEFTNPVENVSTYSTNTQKALNLGVYGADLSYANIFDQSQESMFFMNCSKKMADGLGVTSAFNTETMERIEENMNNRDSLMTIINDAFWIADAHLKENGQDHLSALIITGGWVEGLYLGTKSLKKESPDKGLMQRIADQKFSLDNLVDLLATYDNSEVSMVNKQMKLLQMVFSKIEEEDKEGKVTLIFEQETILEIAEVVEKVRNEFIK